MDAPRKKDFPTPRIASAAEIDRMADKRSDKEWIAERLKDEQTRFMLFADLSLAVESDEEQNNTRLRWYTRDEVNRLGASLEDVMFLGRDPEGACLFAVSLTEARAKAVPGGMDALKPLVDLRSLAMQGELANEELSLAGLARALAAWHQTTHHCGRCGSITNSRDAGWRRTCWACGQEFFPRSDPAVIVLITDGKRCLLGHHKRYAHKFYSTLAGYVEPGEDFESCVRREMREETGIEIGKVKYMASQPWPFPHLSMVGCWAEALTTDLTLDESELYDARWFTRKEVKKMMKDKHPEGLTVPGPHSIAYALIRSFVDH